MYVLFWKIPIEIEIEIEIEMSTRAFILTPPTTWRSLSLRLVVAIVASENALKIAEK